MNLPNYIKHEPPPFGHQWDSYERFKDSDIFALLADRGVGKTRIAIDICSHKHQQGDLDAVLIIAPNVVHTQWIDEQVPGWSGIEYKGFSFALANKTKKHNNALWAFIMDPTEKIRYLAVSIEGMQSHTTVDMIETFFSTTALPPMVIVDESSRIKNPTALQTMNVKKVANFTRTYRCHITGTPAAKSPVDTYSPYDFLKKGYMGCSFTAFKARHTVMKTSYGRGRRYSSVIDKKGWEQCKGGLVRLRGENYGSLPVEDLHDYAGKVGVKLSDLQFIDNAPEYCKYKNVDKLLKRIAPDTFSIRKSECLDLPEKIYERVVLELSPLQKKLIKQLKADAVAEYGGEFLTVEHSAVLKTRILQVCGGHFPHLDTAADDPFTYATLPLKEKNRKLAYMVNAIPELGDQQFIIWAVFRAELTTIHEELSKQFNVARYSANDNPEQTVRDFKNGNTQALIAHPTSLGYGFNFDMAGIQFWFSRDHKTETRLQAEDRSHRATTTKSPVYIDLLHNTPAEFSVLDNLEEGRELNELFMNVKEY